MTPGRPGPYPSSLVAAQVESVARVQRRSRESSNTSSMTIAGSAAVSAPSPETRARPRIGRSPGSSTRSRQATVGRRSTVPQGPDASRAAPCRAGARTINGARTRAGMSPTPPQSPTTITPVASSAPHRPRHDIRASRVALSFSLGRGPACQTMAKKPWSAPRRSASQRSNPAIDSTPASFPSDSKYS